MQVLLFGSIRFCPIALRRWQFSAAVHHMMNKSQLSDDDKGKELMQIVNASSSPPQLPPGWTVLKRTRPPHVLSAGTVDNYYIEPGTGRKFRSLISVHKYLTQGPIDSTQQMQKVHQFEKRAYSEFKLPDDWIVEEKPRRNSTHVDRYYIEPETGVRFRSLVSAMRYLIEGENVMLQPKALEYTVRVTDRNATSGSQCREIVPIGSHSMMQKVQQFEKRSYSELKLPDDWIVEEKPRRNSTHVDRYYIEPETGLRFRSLISAMRYLREGGDIMLQPKALEYTQKLTVCERNATSGNRCREIVPCGNHSMSLRSSNKGMPSDVVKDQMLDCTTQPVKVKWVLKDVNGSMFSPYVNGSTVPNSTRREWSEAFLSSIKDCS